MLVRSILFAVTLSFCSGCAHGPSPGTATQQVDGDNEVARVGRGSVFSQFETEFEARSRLIEAIARLSARDQLVRHMINEWRARSDMSEQDKEAFQSASAAYMAQVDAAHTQELKRLLQDITWREIASAGGDLFIKAFYVVQHSPDLEFQASVLDELTPLVSEGRINAQQYAYLFDRVKLNQGGLQRYGTQFECIDGDYEIADLEAPESLDERRLEVGLQPLSEYIELLRTHSGSC